MESVRCGVSQVRSQSGLKSVRPEVSQVRSQSGMGLVRHGVSQRVPPSAVEIGQISFFGKCSLNE